MSLTQFDVSTAICRSVPGLILTLHLLLLVVLSWVSPRDAQALSALCLAWPLLVPVAFGFAVAAILHVVRSSGPVSGRRVCLATSIISIVGTSICGFLFIRIIATSPFGLQH